MTKPTYKEIAACFDLWGEYYDPDATFTEAEFNSMTLEDRIAWITDAYGEEIIEEDDEDSDDDL